MPIRVYLDSSDYSTLSDPRSASEAILALRREFIELATSGHVEFLYSGAVLSEMAPLQASSTSLATQRAKLVVELCGRNALLSFDNVIKLEMERAAGLIGSTRLPVSHTGDWFPAMNDLVSPLQWADMQREIDTEIKSRGLNREQRRLVKRKLFKSGSAKPVFKEWMKVQSNAMDLTEILQTYPMRPEDAKVIGRYVLGQATKEEANNAFLESLRDPSWMMQWFEAHAGKLTPITEWLRGPAHKLIASAEKLVEHAKKLRERDSLLGTEHAGSVITRTGWRAFQDEILVGVANRFAKHFLGDTTPELALSIVQQNCPGIVTMVRSLHNSLWNSVSRTPREPMESDFIDAVHGMYAPYVHIFRADRYMAPHISAQVVQYGCTVVPRLRDLPGVIRVKIGVNSD